LIKAVLAAASAYGVERYEKKESSCVKSSEAGQVDSRPEYEKEVMGISAMGKKEKQ
jgi:hypothetical protein